MFDAYGGSAFPGIGDILYNINEQVKKYANLNIIINKQSKKNTYLNIAAYWYIFNVQETGTTEYNRLVKVSQTCVSQKNTNKRIDASS